MRLFFLFIFVVMPKFCLSEELVNKILDFPQVTTKLTDRNSLKMWLAGAVSTLIVNPYDEKIRDNWNDHQQMSKHISSTGDFLGSGIPSALIIGGQYFWDNNQSNWIEHARSLTWETLIVTGMKYSFGRKRPGGSESHLSFPSGHTATAFATATSLTYSYGWKVGAVAFPLATFVGFSRLADDAHWGSDVVAGAFIGIIVGRACHFFETDDLGSRETLLFPTFGPDQTALTYLYSF